MFNTICMPTAKAESHDGILIITTFLLQLILYAKHNCLENSSLGVGNVSDESSVFSGCLTIQEILLPVEKLGGYTTAIITAPGQTYGRISGSAQCPWADSKCSNTVQVGCSC